MSFCQHFMKQHCMNISVWNVWTKSASCCRIMLGPLALYETLVLNENILSVFTGAARMWARQVLSRSWVHLFQSHLPLSEHHSSSFIYIVSEPEVVLVAYKPTHCVNKTKELIFDFRKKDCRPLEQQWSWGGACVACKNKAQKQTLKKTWENYFSKFLFTWGAVKCSDWKPHKRGSCTTHKRQAPQRVNNIGTHLLIPRRPNDI